MSFCMNCGAGVPDGARFCPKCGAGIEVNDRSNLNTSESGGEFYSNIPAEQMQQLRTAQKPKGKTSKAIKIILIITVIVVVALIARCVITYSFAEDTTVDYEDIEFQIPARGKIEESASTDASLYFYRGSRNNAHEMVIGAVPDATYLYRNLYDSSSMMDYLTGSLQQFFGGTAGKAKKYLLQDMTLTFLTSMVWI